DAQPAVPLREALQERPDAQVLDLAGRQTRRRVLERLQSVQDQERPPLRQELRESCALLLSGLRSGRKVLAFLATEKAQRRREERLARGRTGLLGSLAVEGPIEVIRTVVVPCREVGRPLGD